LSTFALVSVFFGRSSSLYRPIGVTYPSRCWTLPTPQLAQCRFIVPLARCSIKPQIFVRIWILANIPKLVDDPRDLRVLLAKGWSLFFCDGGFSWPVSYSLLPCGVSGFRVVARLCPSSSPSFCRVASCVLPPVIPPLRWNYRALHARLCSTRQVSTYIMPLSYGGSR